MDEEHTETAIRRDRFSGGPVRGFLSSMDVDERIFAADLAVDRAHVVMLVEQGILSASDATELFEALQSVEAAGYAALPDGEDIHESIETAVIDHVGPVGGRLHTARSRNDEVATCIRHRLRRDIIDAMEAMIGFREALVESAHEELETVMPGYTHLQPAQPTTVAHWLLSYEGGAMRDTDRLFDAYERVNRSPLGAAAFAGTPFDVDRERTADLLGFDGVIENTMDAASTRDFLIETIAACANVATTISGLAEDLIVFSNRGYVDLADEYSSTSSIMPQKKNPDTLELVRATAGNTVAGLTGLLMTLKGLPRAYNRDLQRATPHAWAAIDAVTAAIDVTGGAIATATWNEEVLATAAGEGFSTATGVADLLAMNGVPFRTAHEIVARAVERVAQRSRTDRQSMDHRDDTDVLVSEIEAVASELVGPDGLEGYVDRAMIETVLDPVGSVESRASRGGPASVSVDFQLTVSKRRLADDDDRCVALQSRLAAASDALQKEVSRFG